MNDELNKCYYVLGLRPGASSKDVKAAHRDLAKVWHPDRFVHDPQLQQKAQDKLKEINKAYDQLRSGKAKGYTSPAWTRGHHSRSSVQNANVDGAQGTRWKLILFPGLIFVVAFFVASRSLLRSIEQENQRLIPPIGQVQASPGPAQQQPGSRINNSANESPQGRDRTEPKSQTGESDGASTSQASAASLQPLSTVTVMIDPTTGMIATPNCPVKTRMTYPTGKEPHQHCDLHKAPPIPPLEVSSPSDSRLKSAAKRLAAPTKWFGGKPK
jgi:curved DNA-binding protein CbpA